MVENIEYEPSIQNYRRLLQQDDSDRFTFYFKRKNEGRTVEVFSTVNKARVISSKVDDIFKIDPTITNYTIEIPQGITIEQESEKNIKEIIDKQLKSTTEKIKINKEQEQIFKILQYLLGEIDRNSKQDSNQIINKQEEALSLLNTEFHRISIEYLSAHFYDFIESGSSKDIDINIMKEIIDDYYLNLNSISNSKEEENEENNLNEQEKIFNKMKEKEEEIKVIFYFLIKNDFSKFTKDMIEFIYENIDDEIIEENISQIISILKIHILKLLEIIETKCSTKNKSELNDKTIKCEYSDNELSGIISYLSKMENQQIQLSGGGEKNSSYPIENLIKYDSNNINELFNNKNSKYPRSSDSWIKFDFGDKKINLSSYTIRSNNNNPNNHAHPKTWKIYGSNDDNQWEIIDEQTNNPALNGPYKQHRFECNNENKYYRYIRYTQEDSWDNDKNYQYALYLSCFELFGSILIP